MPRPFKVTKPNTWVPNNIEITHLSSTDTAHIELLNLWLSAPQYHDPSTSLEVFPELHEALSKHGGDLAKLLASDSTQQLQSAPTHHALIALSNGAYASGDTALFLGGLTYKDTPTELAGTGAKLLAAAEQADTADGGSPTSIQVVNTQGGPAAVKALTKSGFDRSPGCHRWSKVTSAQATSESHQAPEKGLTTVSADPDTHQGLTAPESSVAAETHDAKTTKGPQKTRTTSVPPSALSNRYVTLEELLNSLLSRFHGGP